MNITFENAQVKCADSLFNINQSNSEIISVRRFHTNRNPIQFTITLNNVLEKVTNDLCSMEKNTHLERITSLAV